MTKSRLLKKYLAYANCPDFMHMCQHDTMNEAEAWMDKSLHTIYGRVPTPNNIENCWGKIWDIEGLTRDTIWDEIKTRPAQKYSLVEGNLAKVL
jgi:hypothetical protein